MPARIQGEQPVSLHEGVRANQKIWQDSPWLYGSLFPPPGSITLERYAGSSPDCLSQFPLHFDSGLLAKFIHERLVTSSVTK